MRSNKANQEHIPVDMAFSGNLESIALLVKQVVPSPHKYNVLTGVRRWCDALRGTAYYYYRGYPEDVRLYKSALYKAMRIYKHSGKTLIICDKFWDFIAIGLKQLDRGMVTFHLNLLLTVLFPIAELSWLRVAAYEDSISVESQRIVLSALRKDVYRAGQLLLHSQKSFSRYGHPADYFDALRSGANPEVLKKMEILSLPLYTAFIRVGKG